MNKKELILTSAKNINTTIIAIYRILFTTICKVPKNNADTLSISAVNLVYISDELYFWYVSIFHFKI